MVFIVSQEYTDPYNKISRNIINLEGVPDYKIFKTIDEDDSYTVCIVVGDFEKFLFKANSEKDCTKILTNMFSHNSRHDSHIVVDIEAFMIPQIEEEEHTFEDVHQLMLELLEFHGYGELVKVYEKLAIEMEQEDEEEIKCQIDMTAPYVRLEHSVLNGPESTINEVISQRRTSLDISI